MRSMNDPRFKEWRREQRNEPTHAEKILWYSLRGSQLDGRKFRRQHGIGSFIVDFYCPEERLVIEVDGDIHDRLEITAYDAQRQEWLTGEGFAVLRFSNTEVMEQSETVLAKIREIWAGREREPVRWKGSRSRATRTPRRRSSDETRDE